jgi:periplasmic copper chaperone A
MKLSIFFAALFFFATSLVQAHDYRAGSLEIGHPWARATPKGATVAGGYLKITNKGSAADRLVTATSSAATRIEIHEMAMEGSTMRMRPLPNGLEIKPGETVELKPGSFHLMFMDIKQPFEKGQRVKGSLTFEKAGTIEVEYAVEAAGAPASGSHAH